MGNASSKATRKLPTRPPPPWAGTRTAKDSLPSAAQAIRASERRTPDIEKDAKDPDFLSNLSRLGPVRVNHGPGIPNTEQVVDPRLTNTNQLFQSRVASEEEAFSQKLSKNHLYAGALHELLDERKSAQTKQDLQKLADKYGVDVGKMERLSRFLSSPSVNNSSTTRTVDKNGEESLTFSAVWVNPRTEA